VEIQIKGLRIVKVRPMTTEELSKEGWSQGNYNPATALELENGTVIYASCDEEGNSNGCLFGYKPPEKLGKLYKQEPQHFIISCN